MIVGLFWCWRQKAVLSPSHPSSSFISHRGTMDYVSSLDDVPSRSSARPYGDSRSKRVSAGEHSKGCSVKATAPRRTKKVCAERMSAWKWAYNGSKSSSAHGLDYTGWTIVNSRTLAEHEDGVGKGTYSGIERICPSFVQGAGRPGPDDWSDGREDSWDEGQRRSHVECALCVVPNLRRKNKCWMLIVRSRIVNFPGRTGRFGLYVCEAVNKMD